MLEYRVRKSDSKYGIYFNDKLTLLVSKKENALMLADILNADRNGKVYEIITNVECNIFDKETTYTNCTVQILENSVTGETSVGWWRNE